MLQNYLELTQTEREKPGTKLFRDGTNRERDMLQNYLEMTQIERKTCYKTI